MADFNEVIKFLLWAVGRCDRCRNKWADCKCWCYIHRKPYKECPCSTGKNDPEASEAQAVSELSEASSTGPSSPG